MKPRKWRVFKSARHWVVRRPDGRLLGALGGAPHLFHDWSTAWHTALWHARRA